MPILKIRVDDVDTEFRITPVNGKINLNILNKYTKNIDGVYILDRPGYLSYIVKEPKMNRKDWSKIPSSLITKIIRSVDAYIESITLKEKDLRDCYVRINVYESELDDLYRYLGDNSDDWVWDRIKTIEKNINILKEEKEKIEKSLDYVKSDYAIYEEGKDINYEFQEPERIL